MQTSLTNFVICTFSHGTGIGWVVHAYGLDEKEFERSASLQVRCYSTNCFLSIFVLLAFCQFVRVLIFALCRFMVQLLRDPCWGLYAIDP